MPIHSLILGGGKDLETAIGFGKGTGPTNSLGLGAPSSSSTPSSTIVKGLNSINTPGFTSSSTAKNVSVKATAKLPGGLVTKANSIGSYDVIKPNYGQGKHAQRIYVHTIIQHTHII